MVEAASSSLVTQTNEKALYYAGSRGINAFLVLSVKMRFGHYLVITGQKTGVIRSSLPLLRLLCPRPELREHMNHLKAFYTATPEAIDEKTMTFLNSGIADIDELRRLVNVNWDNVIQTLTLSSRSRIIIAPGDRTFRSASSKINL